MSNRKIIICIILILATILITNYMSIKVTKLFAVMERDKDYQKLGLEIDDNNIEYCTVYGYARFSEYKVYKIENDSIDEFKNQLENSNQWNRNKFYEYRMMEFYEIKDNEKIDIDRENLYYYNQSGVYAIFDIKNAKLYYFERGIFDNDQNYSNILGIEIDEETIKTLKNKSIILVDDTIKAAQTSGFFGVCYNHFLYLKYHIVRPEQSSIRQTAKM